MLDYLISIEDLDTVIIIAMMGSYMDVNKIYKVFALSLHMSDILEGVMRVYDKQILSDRYSERMHLKDMDNLFIRRNYYDYISNDVILYVGFSKSMCS